MKNNSLSNQLWGVLKRDRTVMLPVICMVLFGCEILPWFSKTWWRFFFQIKRYRAFKSMTNCNLRKFWNWVLLKSSNHQEHKRTYQTSGEFAWGSVMGVKNLQLYNEELLAKVGRCKHGGRKLIHLSLRDREKRIFIHFSVTG